MGFFKKIMGMAGQESDDPDYHNNLGLEHLGKSDYKAAAAAFRKAIALRPKDSMFLSNLGIALKRLGQIDEAIETMRLSTQADEKDAKSHFNLANTLRENDRLEEAEASYRRALEVDETFDQAKWGLARTLYLGLKLSEARSRYVDALDVFWKDAELREEVTDMLADQIRSFEGVEEAFPIAHEKTSEYLPGFIKDFTARASSLGSGDETVGSILTRHMLETLHQLDRQEARSTQEKIEVCLKMTYLIGFLAKTAE